MHYNNIQYLGKIKRLLIQTKLFSNKIANSCFIWGETGKESSLGLNGLNDVSTPIELISPDNSGFRQVSHNMKHSALITGNGSLYVFGTSTHGQLGLREDVSFNEIKNKIYTITNYSSTFVDKPTKVNDLSGIECKRVACGLSHTAVVTEEGEVWTWGYGGANWSFNCGGLGHGNKNTISIPQKVKWFIEKGIKAVDVACGDTHTLIIDDKGFVYSFGEGEHGRLGIGGTSNAKQPNLIEFFTLSENNLISKVWAEKDFSMALTENKSLYSWGRNDRQQLGIDGGLAMDIYSCETSPRLVPVEGSILDIDLCSSDCIALSENNQILAWGDRQYLEPTMITGIFPDKIIKNKLKFCGSGTNYHAFVLMDGTLWTCNKKISLSSSITCNGHGYINPHREPRQVEALRDFVVKDLSCHENKISVLVD